MGERQPTPGVIPASALINTKLIYATLLASPALPAIGLVGVAILLLIRRGQSGLIASHHVYQARTFWGAAFGYLATVVFDFAGAGLLIYPLVAVWMVARAVHGITRAARGEPIDDPDAFIV